MKGKGKGSAFERKIAKEIVKAYSKFGITQKDCWRSTLSGGHPRAAGDLEISERLAKIFPFCLEMKHRKKIRFENFLMDKRCEENRWVKQTLEGAEKTNGMTPVLVVRANNLPIYAFVRGRTLAGLSFTTWLTSTDNEWLVLRWKQFLRLSIHMIRRFPRLRRANGKYRKRKQGSKHR